MERIDLMASEMSIENVHGRRTDRRRRTDGRTPDVSIYMYYKLTLFEETLFEETFWYAAYMQGLYYFSS